MLSHFLEAYNDLEERTVVFEQGRVTEECI